MEVGKEFSSWESFQNALDLYSNENKVVYVVGTCKTVETANKNESLQCKFPSRFKYCYARMLCKHYGNYTSHSAGLRPHQRTCKTGCTSSILVSANKKRTALVIKEANLQHTHEVSALIFNTYFQNRRLQGEERRLATILLRAGVPLSRVQEFISNCTSKCPTIKDLQNIKAASKGSFTETDGHEFDFLTSLDQLMSEDAECVVEIINFDLVPGAIYLQTSHMLKRMKSFQGGKLQIIAHFINDDKMSIVSVVGVDEDNSSHVFALGVMVISDVSALQGFLETFVNNNEEFCDSIKGVVLDCPKEQTEFLQQLIPQANMAWSQSYILQKFSQELDGKGDMQESLALQTELMNADSEKDYFDKLRELLQGKGKGETNEFLRNWGSCKELWVQYELSPFEGLQHRKSAVEVAYLKSLTVFVKPIMGLSDLIKALLTFDRSGEPGELSKGANLFSVHPSCEQYRQLCFPEASLAIACQIAIALSSVYTIKTETDMIFIKKSDSADEYVLDTSGGKCTCCYYIDTELPCQHIFAWLNMSNKPMFNESLVPIRWQVFGKSITLDALAESLAQGQVPSSFHHDERLKELQGILKDMLGLCCSHSYEQMGKDLVLLKQILMVIKNCTAQKTKVVTEEDKDIHNISVQEPASAPTLPRRRGRPSKKDKLLGEQGQPVLKQPVINNSQTPITSSRHNLRTNIKHKFVTREIHSEGVDISKEIPRKKLKEDTDNHSNADRSVSNTNNGNDLSTIDNILTEAGEGKKVTALKAVSDLSKVSYMKVQSTISSPLPTNKLPVIARDNKQLKSKSDLEDEGSMEEDEDDDEENEEMGDVVEADHTGEDRAEDLDSAEQETPLQKVKKFLDNTAQESLVQLLDTVSSLTSEEVKSQCESNGLATGNMSPVDALLKMCKNTIVTDFIIDHLKQVSPTQSALVHQLSAAIIQRSATTGVPIKEASQMVSYWPSHLPDFPSSRPLDKELTLSEGQILRLGSYKVNQTDMDTLKEGKEISIKILHAYLEILAQKHSGKIFIIPYNMVLSWKAGNYSDRIFKRVHLKTFDFIILPINCGAEFSQSKRESGNIPEPCWMTLVADVKAKTVSILNPKVEDKYAIAANGYMLQWRRYMQIRSVHTGEMLCMWATKQIECNEVEDNHLSGVHLLMNVEALINNLSPIVMTQAHIHNYLHLVAVALHDTDRETTVLCIGGPECQVLAARDADWLQCENCRTWWHRACADQAKPVFYCNSCHQRILAVKGRLPTQGLPDAELSAAGPLDIEPQPVENSSELNNVDDVSK